MLYHFGIDNAEKMRNMELVQNVHSDTAGGGAKRFVYEFEQEVQEKKKLAQQNRRKTGQGNRRSRAFAQPELTEREIEERHGKIMEYKIGQPISWAEFKTYPLEMQEKWVEAFIEKFKCGAKGIALVFGLHYTSFYTYCKRVGLAMPQRTGIYTEEKGDLIREWMGKPPEPVAPVEPKPKRAEPEPPKKPELPYFVNTIQTGRMTLCGNATEIFHTLFSIFRDAQLQLDIEFEVMPAPEPEEPMVPEEPEHAPEPVEPTDQGKVNLNKCNFNDLRRIGMSPNIAANTMQARPFQNVDDLARVAGISKSFFNILREKVTVYDEE